MNPTYGAWIWIKKQFKNHTARSLLISLSAVAVLTTGILYARGVFGVPALETFGDFPNREYRLAPAEQTEPKTLDELLHCDLPRMDTLLMNPAIAQELLNAQTLTDVVDSRMALNNLHNLDEQLASRLAEDPGAIDTAHIAEMTSYKDTETRVVSLAYKPGGSHYTQLAATDALAQQYQTMAALKAASGKLLAPKEYDDLAIMPIAMNMKGVVDNGEAMIHLLPAGDWLPADGYHLYRVINGQSVLIAENAAAPSDALAGSIGGEDAPKVQALYRQAELSDTKLSQLGMTVSQFREAAYRMDTAEKKKRIAGQMDFIKMHETLITEPDGVEQKIPETDLLLGSPVHVVDRQPNGQYQSAAVQSRIWAQFSVTQSALPSGIDSFKAQPNGEARFKLAQSVMAARQQISTLSFVDAAFAEDAGFLVRDDLSALGLADGTIVTYRVETPDHQTSTLDVAYGHANSPTKPQGLMGYGIDGKVPLRWNAAENPLERGIISGYMIERKRDGESKFTVVNGEPVAITYILNENDIYFETPSFFEDDVETGVTVEYRIRSLDVFGRMSEPSDAIKLKVEQVTPPNAPTVSTPVFSVDRSGTSASEMKAVQNTIDQNPGKTGIVLPVYTDSADTVRFTVYRAEAVGVRPYGKPVPIANLSYENPRAKASATPEASPGPASQVQAQVGFKGVNGTQQALLKKYTTNYPDLVYFDADIKEGVTYKYWVSVWDAWNNESAWSQSVSYGVKTDAEPSVPSALNAAMLVRELPDRSQDPPGLVDDSPAMLSNLPHMSSAPVLSIKGANTETVKQAAESGVAIGKYLSAIGAPELIDKRFDNLPEQKYIHMLLAVRGEDVLPSGGAWLRWPAYSGEGLGGYAVFRPVFPVGSLPDLQKMSRSELIQLGSWKKTTSKTLAQNQLFVTGLDKTPGRVHLFLVCLQPEAEAEGAAASDEDFEYSIIDSGTVGGEKKQYEPIARLTSQELHFEADRGYPLFWSAQPGNPEYTVLYRIYDKDEQRLMNQMSFDEKMALPWSDAKTTDTRMYVKVNKVNADDIIEFYVCLETGSNFAYELIPDDGPEAEPHAGFVSLDWDIPSDPQVQFYRVYRAEVSSFKTPADESKLAWTLVGDRLNAPCYTDPVEQSRAHYFYYKVAAVSLWGVESSSGAVKPFRVPATKPPQTPNLLLPLQSKDGVKVNFSAVPYCDKYVIYRTAIPNINDGVLAKLNGGVKSALFTMPTTEDAFLKSLLDSAARMTEKPASYAALNAISRLKTLKYADTRQLSNLTANSKLSTYQQILGELGPLALADYRDLSVEMMKRVVWQPVGELRVDYETGAMLDPDTGNPVDPTDPATGLLKPLSIVDRHAEYGIMYLYTVQAWNDDGLGSTRPEPIEATPRRNGPFNPLENLRGEWADKQPVLTWNPPSMPNLTPERCLEETVGYIVYRSDKKDGEYYQASPMVFAPTWTDKSADPFAHNWYRVKVLDTGGYLSEFSEPLLMQMNFVSKVTPKIPHYPLVPQQAPSITFENQVFTVAARTPFEARYALTGTEPIAVTVAAADANGSPVAGFTVDGAAKKVLAGPGLGIGTYRVTATAKNAAGEGSASFTLEVKTPGAAPVITIDPGFFMVFQDDDNQMQYELTGDAPITMLLEEKADGAYVPARPQLSLDTAGLAVVADTLNLAPGMYPLRLTATNAAGMDQKEFILTVGEPERRTAPKLALRDDQYTFSFSRPLFPSGAFEVPLVASGSAPLTWSLEPYTDPTGIPGTVPDAVGIGPNGLLSIEKNIRAGSYFFYVVVSNDLGNDKQLVHMEISSALTPTVTFRPRALSAPGGRSAGIVPLVQLSSSLPPAGKNSFVSDHVDCAGFKLTNVSLAMADASTPSLPPVYAGTAMLSFDGVEPIPVSLIGATIESEEDGGIDVMTGGAVYLAEPAALKNTGVTLISMDISPQNDRQTVSGYVKSTQPGRNVMGSAYAIEFTDAELSSEGTIDADVTLPATKYEQFVLHDISNIQIRLRSTAFDTFFLMASCKKVTMKAPLETLNNEGVVFGPGSYGFDLDGKISGTMAATEKEQFLQLLVPGGSALRVTALLFFQHGVAQPESFIRGRLILPFERADAVGNGVPGVYAGTHPKTNLMDALSEEDAQKVNESIDKYRLVVLDDFILKFGQKVQENALLIVPNDKAQQDECAFVDFNVKDWSGKGFTVESANMTPTRMTERTLSIDLQRSQAVVVSPTAVSVDLDREGFVPIAGGGENPLIQTPKETEKPFWVGLVMKGGSVSLPPDFIESAQGDSIRFGLAEGEMIYDLNGFSYQSYLYSDSKEGVPALLGDKLGGFEDVRVHDCLLDMYANRVNLEINAKVCLELFNQNWVNAKLYTNKEDNSDGKAGQLLCSVAPTVIENSNGVGVGLTIDGGFFKPDGLHINGSLALQTSEVQTLPGSPLSFADMIVPKHMEMTNRQNDPGRKYANVQLDKPTDIVFQGFSMEARAFDIEHSWHKSGDFQAANWLTLSGSTVLAENIPMGQETTDTVLLECLQTESPPIVVYEESHSVLKANFDDCVEVSGVLVPKLTAAGQSARSGAGGVIARTNVHPLGITRLSAGSAPSVPALPPMPALPNAEDILKDAKASAEEKLAAYQKALKDEIDKYKKAVEAELAKYKDLPESEAQKYRKEAEKQLKTYTDKAVGEIEKYLNITKEELKKYKEELEKELGEYIDLGKLSQGLIEFNTEKLNLNYLSQLKALPVVTEVRFGYDMDNKRCYFAVGLMPKNKPGSSTETIPINFGAGDIRNFTGIVTYNMVVKRDAQARHEFPAESTKMAAFIKDLPVHRASGSTFAAGIRGTMKIIGFCEIRKMYFGFEKGPIVNADGGVYVPLDVAGMISGDGMKEVGTVAIVYDHPNRYFSFSMTLNDINLVAAKVSGSFGFEFSPHLFGVSMGYPETLAGNISVFRFGVGIGFRIDSVDGNHIKAKLEIGLQKEVDIEIVYLSGYLYAGADGGFYWGGEENNDRFYLTLYLKGGIKGGIKLGEARWDIIKLMLDARGTIESVPHSDHWRLSCSAKVSYCLDLYLFSIDGSVNAAFDTTIAAPL